MKSLASFSALLLLASLAVAAPAPVIPVPADGAITVSGKLATGIMAMGGETTGITLTTSTMTYELDIKDALLSRKATELDGKQVKVTGTLSVKAGVEVAQRRIISVTALDAAPATQPATGTAPK